MGHIIEETPEGQAYLKSVNSFNERYNGRYFADVEFIPRNDSGGGYSDKVNASFLSVNLPDVLTVDGPNVAAYAANGGDLVSEDGLTTDGYFNSDANVETMKYFRGLVDNGYMSSVPIQNLFEIGRAAFKFDGAWEVNTIYTI